MRWGLLWSTPVGWGSCVGCWWCESGWAWRFVPGWSAGLHPRTEALVQGHERNQLQTVYSMCRVIWQAASACAGSLLTEHTFEGLVALQLGATSGRVLQRPIIIIPAPDWWLFAFLFWHQVNYRYINCSYIFPCLYLIFGLNSVCGFASW